MRARRAILGLAIAVGAASLVLPGGGSAAPADQPPSVPVLDPLEPTSTEAPLEETPPPPPANPGDSTADRGSPIQVTPTLPPPTTTTTTTLPPDPTILPWFSGTGRRVVYSISAQRVWAVEADGTVVKTHPVSGKRGVPNPGTYSVWSRSLHTSSIDNPKVRWMYMVRFAWGPDGGNIGFHEIPTECRTWTSWTTGTNCWKLQSVSQLGQPLSGGCVRQSTPDAIWIWDWAQLGTKVVVLA